MLIGIERSQRQVRGQVTHKTALASAGIAQKDHF